jgi:hypothetical protein
VKYVETSFRGHDTMLLTGADPEPLYDVLSLVDVRSCVKYDDHGVEDRRKKS